MGVGRLGGLLALLDCPLLGGAAGGVLGSTRRGRLSRRLCTGAGGGLLGGSLRGRSAGRLGPRHREAGLLGSSGGRSRLGGGPQAVLTPTLEGHGGVAQRGQLGGHRLLLALDLRRGSRDGLGLGLSVRPRLLGPLRRGQLLACARAAWRRMVSATTEVADARCSVRLRAAPTASREAARSSSSCGP